MLVKLVYSYVHLVCDHDHLYIGNKDHSRLHIDKPVYYLIVDDSKLNININVCVASYLCFNSYCCNVTRGGEEYNVPCKIKVIGDFM